MYQVLQQYERSFLASLARRYLALTKTHSERACLHLLDRVGTVGIER